MISWSLFNFLALNKIKFQINVVGDGADASTLLDKFADSIASSNCTSSLSCNASEEGTKAVPSPDDESGIFDHFLNNKLIKNCLAASSKSKSSLADIPLPSTSYSSTVVKQEVKDD